MRKEVEKYIQKKYGSDPEHLWRSYPNYSVFRHADNRKWFAIIMDVDSGKIGSPGTERVDIIDVKIDASFEITASAKQKKKFRQPKEWIIPANPKYYDIVHAFDDEEIINWKQGAGIIKGDTVFMYAGAPVSAVLYKCKVIETDIPYDYSDRNLTIKALMKIQLQKRYKPDKFTFEVLKDEYGIAAIRGPRGITNSLSAALRKG